LIGYGEVPRRLGPVLQALGARVLYTARSRQADACGEFVALPQLLAAADIVSLHVPLTAETERMIDAAALAAMKPGAVLVNTARGGLVDEAALVQALQSGRLRAAGLDVLAVEPAGAGFALARLDNVVMTPHVAWLTPETLARSLEVAIENCRRLRDGQPLLNEVKT
jgi:phosphoglycerate dehydrogenase-like enzyme